MSKQIRDLQELFSQNLYEGDGQELAQSFNPFVSLHRIQEHTHLRILV